MGAVQGAKTLILYVDFGLNMPSSLIQINKISNKFKQQNWSASFKGDLNLWIFVGILGFQGVAMLL